MQKSFYLILCLLTTFSLYAKENQLIKPAALQAGDTVAIVSPGFRVHEDQHLEFAAERLEALGLKVIFGEAVLDQKGYLAGSDERRATDINKMFADPNVKAIFAVRGGWGSARLLDLLDYEMIKQNPKIFLGYSDITSLLLGIQRHANLLTFHGPVLNSELPAFTANYLRELLFDGKKVVFENEKVETDDLISTTNRIQTITPGTAQGQLIGGNLAVLSALLGSDFVPSFKDKILFLEDVGEDVYKIDRMLTHLKLIGALDEINGFVFGTCQNCTAGVPYGSFRLFEVMEQHIKPLGIPAWYGAMFGHQKKTFTLPVGAQVEIDAETGTIALLEPVVIVNASASSIN